MHVIFDTHSGGVPRKLNDANCTSTRCPGPAKNIYKHWRVVLLKLIVTGAENVPFCGPPMRDTNV